MKMKMKMKTTITTIMMTVLLMHVQAIDIPQMRLMAVKNNVTCILVFGDSSVDPGNNNRLHTTNKGNFPPYGKDFIQGHPTGRFTNGRLPTDLIAEELGISTEIPAFLDASTGKTKLLHGVSFASAGSGYDDLTANLGEVLSFPKQLEYLRHYKIHLREFVGERRAEELVRNAIFVISASTNDFINNYYLEPTRSKQFTVAEYADFLVRRAASYIKEMRRVGGRRFAVVGAPAFGCMPIMLTLSGTTGCVEAYNQVAASFNSKLRAELGRLKKMMGIRVGYVDAYGPLIDAIKNPSKYGFSVTSKGCCGTGEIEFGDSCRGQTTCKDDGEYVYWDAVHPTEKMYRIIVEGALTTVAKEILI